MFRHAFPALLLILLAAHSAADDVLVLKDGRRVSGAVREKKGEYTVRVEGQELIFHEEEVLRLCKTPWDLIGERTKMHDEAKEIFLEAMKIEDLSAQGRRMEKALEKITGAREAYAEARDLFPESRWSDLDKKLVEVMQLMRMIRERIGSRLTAAPPPVEVKEPEPERGEEPPPPAQSPLTEALRILADKDRRMNAQPRRLARGLFRVAAEGDGTLRDYGMAAFFLLDRARDANSPGLTEALNAYLAKHDVTKLESFKPGQHIEAALFLAGKAGELLSKDENADAAPLALLAAAHLSTALEQGVPSGVSGMLQSCAEKLGYGKSEYSKVYGTPEGLAAYDLAVWTELGAYDLASVQFRRDYLQLRDFGAHYAYAWLALADATSKKTNYRKAYGEWMKLCRGPWSRDQKDHAKAIADSLRERFPCRACGGTNQIRCQACRGKKKVNLQCKGCGGSGKIQRPRLGVVNCRACKGKGRWYNVDCPLCKKTGLVKCKARDCRPVKLPTMDFFVSATRCRACIGRGTLFRNIAYRCPACFGLGMKLLPKDDPSKELK